MVVDTHISVENYSFVVMSQRTHEYDYYYNSISGILVVYTANWVLMCYVVYRLFPKQKNDIDCESKAQSKPKQFIYQAS